MMIDEGGPAKHKWKPTDTLWLHGQFIGEIVALFAPGWYFVRDLYGSGCIGEEHAWDKAGVEVLAESRRERENGGG